MPGVCPPPEAVSQLPPCDVAETVNGVLPPLKNAVKLCGGGAEPSAGTKNERLPGAGVMVDAVPTLSVTCTVCGLLVAVGEVTVKVPVYCPAVRFA